MNTDSGFLLIANGDEYLKQASLAARRVKQVTDYPVGIVTDQKVDDECFDKVIRDENPAYSFWDKPRNIARTPFERTIYIDADFYVSQRTTELFELLDKTEMVMCLDERTVEREETREIFDNRVPLAFPEFNTGLIAYNRDRISSFAERWKELYGSTHEPDQYSFLAAVYDTEVDYTAVSKNYNVIPPNYVRGEVHGIHDIWNDCSTLEEVEQWFETWNRTDTHRFLAMNTVTVIPVRGGVTWLASVLYDRALYASYAHHRFRHSLRERGVVETLKRTARFLLS